MTATTDEAKKHRYRQKISEYMTRAEDIKKHIEKEKEGINEGYQEEAVKPFLVMPSQETRQGAETDAQ